MIDAIRELDMFNIGYDAGKNGLSDLDQLSRVICRSMPRPDQVKAEAMIRAGYEYCLLEQTAMINDGVRLPYRP